jgi:hypothetical protein
MSTDLCNFFLPFSKNIRKLNMDAKGWTMEELAKELSIPENTVMQRIHRHKIEPIYRGSIYPPDTLDQIREAPMGRPRKKKTE